MKPSEITEWPPPLLKPAQTERPRGLGFLPVVAGLAAATGGMNIIMGDYLLAGLMLTVTFVCMRRAVRDW